MISTALLYFLYYFVYALTSPLRLLPNASLPDFIQNNNANLINLLNNLNSFVDLKSFFAVFTILLIFETSILTLKVLFWLRKLI